MFQGSALRSPCGKTGITLRGTVPPKSQGRFTLPRSAGLDINHVILRLKKVYRYFITLWCSQLILLSTDSADSIEV